LRSACLEWSMFPPDGRTSMETGEGACCERADDGERAAALLAEFRIWLVRERGLSAETVPLLRQPGEGVPGRDRRAGGGARAGRGTGNRVHGGSLAGP